MQGPLDRSQIRELDDARAYANHIGKPLLCPIDINPWRLEHPPEGDIGEWLRDGPLRIVAQAMGRLRDKAGRPVGWHAVTVRENFEAEDGDNREHAHIICHCALCDRPKLAKMLDAAYPSAAGERAILVHVDEDLDEDGWVYRLKQRAGNTAGPPSPRRPTPQRFHKEDGAPVAAVLGRRISISRSIAKPERTRRGWQKQRDENRRVRSIVSKAQRARHEPVPSTGMIVSPQGLV